MRIRANRFLALCLGASFFIPFVLSGCCKHCGGERCLPRSRWQSPTIQVTHALLVVNRPELRIIEIDGKHVSPTCVSASGVREYYLVPGTHTITAVYRYDSPPEEGFMAGMHGKDASRTWVFEVAHAYVAYYREHPGSVPEGDSGVAYVETNVLNPPELYWSLEVADLADPSVEPEVVDARDYIDWVHGEYEPLASGLDATSLVQQEQGQAEL
jgi:hypothetical protein